jgi:hypothetical protein
MDYSTATTLMSLANFFQQLAFFGGKIVFRKLFPAIVVFGATFAVFGHLLPKIISENRWLRWFRQYDQSIDASIYIMYNDRVNVFQWSVIWLG